MYGQLFNRVRRILPVLIILIYSSQQQVSHAQSINTETSRLSCRAGEIKYFNYRSLTQLWNNPDQQLLVLAKVRMICLPSIKGFEIRYWSNILAYEYHYLDANGNVLRSGKSDSYRKDTVEEEAGFLGSIKRALKKTGDWFAMAWNKTKTWISAGLPKLLTPKELHEEGITIPIECRPDAEQSEMDPVEEELPAEYSGGWSEEKNGTHGGSIGAQMWEKSTPRPDTYRTYDEQVLEQKIDKIIRLDFIVFQRYTGEVYNIGHLRIETEQSLNFKRHIGDLFSTNLVKNISLAREETPFGRQKVLYSNFKTSTLTEPFSSGEVTKDYPFNRGEGSSDTVNGGRSRAADTSYETRSSTSDIIGVMRKVDAKEMLDLPTRMIAPDLKQVKVTLEQQQRIIAGSIASVVGQISIDIIQRAEVANRKVGTGRSSSAKNEIDIEKMFKISSTFVINRVSAQEEQELIRSVKRPRWQNNREKRSTGNVGTSNRLNKGQLIQLEEKLKNLMTSSMVIPQEQTSSIEKNKLDRLKSLRNKVNVSIKKGMLAHNFQRGEGGDFESIVSQVMLEFKSDRLKGKNKDQRLVSDIEELLELEAEVGTNNNRDSMSKLLRDLAREQEVRSHCLDSLGSFEESLGSGRQGKKELERCSAVLRALTLAGYTAAEDILFEMIDECLTASLSCQESNNNNCRATKHYYDTVRHQLSEVLSKVNNPSDRLLDRMLTKYKRPFDSLKRQHSYRRLVNSGNEQQNCSETRASAQKGKKSTRTPQKSPIEKYERPDFSSLLISLTELAAKPSVSANKRNQIIDSLLQLLSRKGCGKKRPTQDVEILESMASFHEAHKQIADQVLKKVRQCSRREAYLIACIHALRGQLCNEQVQIMLSEVLRLNKVSCFVKREVVYTLHEAQQVNQLKFIENNKPMQWPATGLNMLDSTLLQLLGGTTSERGCLSPLIKDYMRKKEPSVELARMGTDLQVDNSFRSGPGNEEFHCNRWPSEGATNLSVLGPDVKRSIRCSVNKLWGVNRARIGFGMELVNDQLESGENRFIGNFPIRGEFLGSKMELGRMQVSVQGGKLRTRMYIFAYTKWDNTLDCLSVKPRLEKRFRLFMKKIYHIVVFVYLRIGVELDINSICRLTSSHLLADEGEINVSPGVTIHASLESKMDMLVIRSGIQLAIRHGIDTHVRVSKPPETCMTVMSTRQGMSISTSYWSKLLKLDCVYLGSQFLGTKPTALQWTLPEGDKPTIWLNNQCIANQTLNARAIAGSLDTTVSGLS